MASTTLTRERDISPAKSRPSAEENFLWTFAKLVVSYTSSLKITVTLLAMGIFIIFVGTLAQATMDMWDVMAHYFRTWICFVPFDVFFPPAWFPEGYLPTSLGCVGNRFPEFVLLPFTQIKFYFGFPFPGGASIGVGLFLNLMSAYLWHFRIQARGARDLLAGFALLILGVGISLGVVWSGHNSHGAQGDPLLSWGVMWAGFQSLLVLGLVALAAVAVVLPAELRAARMSALLVAGIIGFVLVALYFSGASLSVNPSSVRILWQIGKGIFAGVVLLGAGLILYRKRGGVVTMHFGVAILMFGEFFVSYYNNEEQMSIEEGRTINYAYDIRTTELAFVDPSAKNLDRVIVIPQSRLKPGEWITDDALPCDVKIEKYARSSALERRQEDDMPPADYHGLAREVTIDDAPSAAGADVGGKVNLASAMVSLRTKGGEPLGTYLLTQVPEVIVRDKSGAIVGRYALAQELDKQSELTKLGGIDYQLALRFQRNYKPYEVELLRVRKDDYLGTDTPRNYSSDVHFADGPRKADFEKHIWMNNPLRYAGETFYQSGYHQDPATGRRYTTLQVVTNRGWMIPYLACGVVMVGMLAQFCMTLYRFLLRYVFPPAAVAGLVGEGALGGPAKPAVISEAMRKPAKGKPGPALAPLRQKKRSLWLAAGLCTLFALWVSSKAFLPSSGKDELDTTRFGSLPVVYEGRSKPFDTLARNMLKNISKTEVYTDQYGRTQPAIRWLLEVVSGRPEVDEYEIFRVEHPDVRETLGLKPKFGSRYSINEIKPKFDELDRQAKLADELDEKKLEPYQKRLLELYRKLQLFVALKQGHQLPEAGLTAPLDQANEILGLARMQHELPAKRLPLAVPTANAEKPWEPLGPAASRMYVQALATRYKTKTPAELTVKLVSPEPPPELMASLLKTGVVERVAEIVRMQNKKVSEKALREQAEAAYARMPEEMRGHLEQDVRAEVLVNWQDMRKRVESEIGFLLGTEKMGAEPNPAALSLTKMLAAYKDNNATKFNAALDDYDVALEEYPPAETNLSRIHFEQWYNAFMPYYTADVLYIVAFLLVCFSWLLLSPNVGRAAFWILLLAFSLHTFAILSRIIISERPPVTNLYSSAIFIGWAFVLITLILEKLFPLGIAAADGAVGGFLTLTIAYFLALDGDTFTVMQAVLDTQFWLSTHVVCITLGYTATFAAGFLGLAYVVFGLCSPALGMNVGRVIDLMYGKDNTAVAESVRALSLGRLLSTMIYGVLCFAVFFSLVGTVLGGLWADDSWGRFWGWDPKENGALIIVIWNVIILHCRWDKMVRDRGLAVLAVVGNIVTSWSWFGVNELGIGLHSYGFTEGRLLFLGRFVLVQLLVIGIGLLPKAFWWSFKGASAVTAEVV